MGRFLRAAVSANTQRTYSGPRMKYRAYCATLLIDPLPVTEAKLASFLTHTAVSTKLAAATIKTYRSAINTMHEESEYGHLPGAGESPLLSRLVTGIAREKAAADKAKRLSKPQTLDLTPDLLLRIEPLVSRSQPESVMLWAAVCLATFGTLRISELLGSSQNRDRALLATQLVFLSADRRILTRTDGPHSLEPSMAELTLGATKTDQLAESSEPIIIAAEIAVSALWRWSHMRDSIPAFGPTLFAAKLAFPRIADFIKDYLEQIGLGRPHLTGKCFRRGGASGMTESGAARADIAAHGRWKSVQMVETYSNEQSKKARAIALNKSLGTRR